MVIKRKKSKEPEAYSMFESSEVVQSSGTGQTPKSFKKSVRRIATGRDALFSDREKVPRAIAEEGRKSGVVQKDQDGVWRIISYKTNPPEFWNAHYKSKKDAENALKAYQANRR